MVRVAVVDEMELLVGAVQIFRLFEGGDLVFEMGPRPSRFGTAKVDRPPSYGRGPA